MPAEPRPIHLSTPDQFCVGDWIGVPGYERDVVTKVVFHPDDEMLPGHVYIRTTRTAHMLDETELFEHTPVEPIPGIGLMHPAFGDWGVA